MNDEDFNEYYRRRAVEVTDEIIKCGLKLMADRDSLLVDLLSAKVRRRMELDSQLKQVSHDAVAGMRYELEANNERAAATICRIGRQLAQCVDTMRRLSPCATDGDDEKQTMITKNKSLAKIVKQRSERLEKSLYKVRSLEVILQQKQYENDQIRQVVAKCSHHRNRLSQYRQNNDSH